MLYFLSGIFILLLAYLGENVISLRGADVYLIAVGWTLLIVGLVSLVLARAK